MLICAYHKEVFSYMRARYLELPRYHNLLYQLSLHACAMSRTIRTDSTVNLDQ